MRKLLKTASLLALGIGIATPAFPATTTVDDIPLDSASTAAVKPNIMFVLDNSGSMCWQQMPDDASFGSNVAGTYPSVAGNCQDNGSTMTVGKYGQFASHCNGVYYRPASTYQLPVYSNGTSFPAAAVGQTYQDGFQAYTGVTAKDNVVTAVATGSGTTTVTIPSTTGASLSLKVSACPTGMVASASGVNPTALMYYVNAEGFLGAHRVFGVYESCSSTTLKIKVTDVMGAGYSAPASQWKAAKVPFTYEYLGAEKDIDFEYSITGTLNTTTNFYNECKASANSTPTKFRFQPVTDLQNHANWYSYYRSRLNTMKTAMTLSFGGMLDPEKYRIGYTTITYSGTDNTNDAYLDIGDYCDAATNCTQRQNLFSKIFKAKAGGSTGLRNALSKAGLLYAGKLLTGARDPVQHSCQKNFALMSTDGYWNAGTGWPAADTGGYRIPTGACTGTACYSLLNVGHQDSSGSGDYRDYLSGLSRTVAAPQLDKSVGGAGTANTLADVAMYYYKTVLRDPSLNNCTSGSTSEDLCTTPGKVPVSAKDCNRYPHMNTFTIGLGVQGYYNSDNYLTGGSTDYNALAAGTTQWPSIASGTALTVDDLWHAAVNGRGEYYSAKSAASIVSSLTKALTAISAHAGTGGGAGGSNQQLSAGDSNAYLSRYYPSDWSGDVLALKLDPVTGGLTAAPGEPATECSIGSGTYLWSARNQLDALMASSPDASARKIYMAKGGVLDDFISTNLPSPPGSPDFDPSTLSQYASLTPTDQAKATKDNLVAYLRGVSSVTLGGGGTCCSDRDGNTYRLFRDRPHALGDIVASSPYFVGKSPFKYTDAGYIPFRDGTTTTRQRVVYVGANDGMLHAFDAGAPVAGGSPTDGTGNELWAFVPTAMLPKLKNLADFTYPTNHQYFVNGSIHVGDVADASGNWRTVLVSGLGAGGRDYFALDVTNPASPILLWEFSVKNPGYADNIGYTVGAPLITKSKKTGKWQVLLPSGLNNEGPGDGRGHLFVVDALTGVVQDDIITAGPADSSRSALVGIANWVDTTLEDNSTQHVYGGDLEGNLWRFDITAPSVVKLAELGKPITHRPELGQVTLGGSKNRWIFVSTGKALSKDDIDGTTVAGTTVQSFFAVKDDLVATYSGPFKSVSGVKQLNLVAGGPAGRQLDYVTGAASANGWWFDFDVSPGERVTTDISLQVGWLSFGTTAPSAAATACDANLQGYQYFIPYSPPDTGSSPSWAITAVGGALVSGSGILQTTVGTTVAVVTDSKGNVTVVQNADPIGGGTVRRVSWRELLK